jgi:hypothetical protein
VDVPGAWRWTFRLSALLALIAGLMLFAGASDTESWFAWTIEPSQTAAFLGATYWAVVVLFAWSAGRGSWDEVRLAALAETLAAVLLLAATVLHLDKFHEDLFGYFWIAVYAGAAPALVALLLLARGGPRSHQLGAERGAGLPRGLRLLLALQALVFAAYGFALFLFPESADASWPWPLTPLTARAIAAFLLGFAVAAAVVVHEGAAERLRGAAWTYVALAALEILAAVIHTDDFDSGAGLAAFLVFWVTIAAAGVWGLVYSGRSSRSAFSVS